MPSPTQWGTFLLASLVFLPQFTDRSAAAGPQLLALGAAFCLLAVASDSLWALLASRVREWFASRPQRLDPLSGLGGSLMVASG